MSTSTNVLIFIHKYLQYGDRYAVEVRLPPVPGEVSAVVLQQSLRDLDTEYRNFFDGLKGKRPRMGAPRFKSRKAKGSGNRARAWVKVARAHAQVVDARREFHHQLSTKIIREDQAVAVEDLAVEGLARTRLAKSVHGAGWSAFVAMLEYKAARYGRTFHRIGRFEPTSRVCCVCGAKDGPKPLRVRFWECAGARGRPRPGHQRGG